MSGKITFIADIKSFFKDLLSIVENHFANIIFGVLIIALFFLFRKWLSKNISAIFAKLFKKNPMIGSGIRTSVQSPLKAFFLILGFYLGAMVIGFSPSVFGCSYNKGFQDMQYRPYNMGSRKLYTICDLSCDKV